MKKLGIIVARFQVPTLHVGHTAFIKHVADQSDKLVVFLGYKVNQPDSKNPFPFEVRKAMLKDVLRRLGLEDKVVIDQIEDHPLSNERWSDELDKKTGVHKSALALETNDDIDISLYGSRDSFIKHYNGAYKTVEIEQTHKSSGTEIRSKVFALLPEELTDMHREGMVYAQKFIYPMGMAVVDVAVYKREGNTISLLLGRKPREDTYRLIGGFFDVALDATLEDAALRELKEEVGDIEVSAPIYIASSKIDDWRYRDNEHKIISSLFAVEYKKGTPISQDDIEEIKWVKLGDLKSVPITENHKHFIEAVVTYISTSI